MNQFYIVIALVAAFARAQEEPLSIGLGVLSPSYSQTVGKENVKVNFEQKNNGFSYSVGDPTSGTKSFLNFGSAATNAAINPAGYADADLSAHSGPNPSAYAGSNPSAYAGPNPSAYAGPNPSAYAGPNPSAYADPASSGYVAPQANPAYSGFAGYQQPSLGGYTGFGGSGSENAYGGSPAIPSHYNDQGSDSVAPNKYYEESARKPEEPSQILPAGFSYHGTEGQSFLRQGDSPNFMVSNENKESARGIAEQSFHDNLKGNRPQSSGKVLANGLVGYGPGGPRGNLPVGGYAGPQAGGLFREHGGHD